MSNQTKMIIITSNEDLIDQLSLNKAAKDIRIIDLDANKTTTSMSKVNNNLLDLTFLAQFSELVCIYYLK